MIFNQLNPNTDIVAGRTNRIDSGFWDNGLTFSSQSAFTDNFYALTQSSVTPSPSYGASIYDIRRTMYYVDVFPDATTLSNNDPYFSGRRSRDSRSRVANAAARTRRRYRQAPMAPLET